MSLSVEIDLSEIHSLGADLHAQVRRGNERAVRVAVEAAVRRAKRDAPVSPENGGRLRDNIRSQSIQTTENSASTRLVIGVKYGKFVVDGTRPHVIEARRKKMLRWLQGGVARFSLRVHHPGTKSNPFLSGAAEVAERTLEQGVDRGVDDAIAKVTK